MRAAAAAFAAALALGACSGPVPDPAPTVPATVSASSAAPASSASPSATATPASSLAGTATAFYDAPNQADTGLAAAESAGRAADADLLRRIAAQPVATWLGDWTPDVTGTVATLTAEAAAADQIALFVAYNIPGRDCGLYSAGGAEVDRYLAWVDQVAAGIDPASVTWVILEPDALAQLGDCDGQGDRAALLAGAAKRLDDAGARVFLDAGHSGWLSQTEAASRIEAVGTAHLAGFATNTSNYNALDDERAWGDAVGAAVGLPYVTDTSRNGNGSTGEWCNPRGRALGAPPAVDDAVLATGAGMVATVWAKVPGESDGTCNGGPAAGQWWEEVALELARDAS